MDVGVAPDERDEDVDDWPPLLVTAVDDDVVDVRAPDEDEDEDEDVDLVFETAELMAVLEDRVDVEDMLMLELVALDGGPYRAGLFGSLQR